MRFRAKRLRLIVCFGALALSVAACLAFSMLQCRPAWYAPRSIDYHLLASDKHAQIQLENRISAALNAGESVEVVLTQELLDRWIAARHELWPGEAPSLDSLEQPVLVLEENGVVRAAALYTRGGLRCVLSTAFRIGINERDILITPVSVRAGLLPAPLGFVERVLDDLAGKSRSRDFTLERRGLALRNEWTWPNGKRLFRFSDLTISAGELRVRLEPLE